MSRFTAVFGRIEILLAIVLTIAVAVLYLTARDAGPVRAIEGTTLDWRFRLRGPRTPGPAVVLVAIDDRTLAELGRWPFSRAWLARAVDAIAADGARSIVFDLLLTGAQASEAPHDDREREREGTPGPSDAAPLSVADADLAQSMARAGNVVVPFAFVFDPAVANVEQPPPALGAAAFRVVASQADAGSAPLTPAAGVLAPLPAFLESGYPAHVTVFLEPDGSLRLSHPAIGYGEAYYPSLPLEAVRLFLGLGRDQVALEVGSGIALGDRMLTTGPDMALATDYAGPAGTYPTWSLVDVTGGRFESGSFRDKIVLIGATAAGLGGGFVTPYDPALPGVEVFANVVDNTLTREFLTRSTGVGGLDVSTIVLAGLTIAGLGLLRRPAATIAGALALLGAWCAIALYGFIAHGIWLAFTFPAVTIVAGAGTLIAGRSLREAGLRRRAEQERESLTRYVSPLAAVRLQTGADVRVSDRSGTAAIMFVDLVGSTGLGEAMSPEETAVLLRRFHRSVERAAHTHQGLVDKFIGDGALLVFGAPSGGPADAANAIACARQIVGEMEVWSGELQTAGKPPLACGIGLHFGPVTVAEVGGEAHAQVTVTGDTVNVASRLEALTRTWQTTLIASDAAVEAARRTGAAALDGFQVLPDQEIRGRTRPVAIWGWPRPQIETGPPSAPSAQPEEPS